MTGSGDNGARATPAHSGAFTATHRSVVLAAAGQPQSPHAAVALEELCRTYWYPLYLYVRRRGHSPEDAQDLTQQFFALFLQKEYFHLADPRRGRFRTFLLHALEHFLVNEWKRAQRVKRGGGIRCLSLDADDAERRYAIEPVTTLTPERAYEKRWAMTLLEQVLAALQQEYMQSGQNRLSVSGELLARQNADAGPAGGGAAFEEARLQVAPTTHGRPRFNVPSIASVEAFSFMPLPAAARCHNFIAERP